MKPPTKRLKPPCKILRTSIFYGNTTINQTRIQHNINSISSLPISTSFSHESSSLNSSIELLKDNKQHLNNAKPIKHPLKPTDSLNNSIETYSCTNSNNWNIIRNSNDYNGCHSRHRKRTASIFIELKERKFASSKIVKPMVHINKISNIDTSCPSSSFKRCNDKKGKIYRNELGIEGTESLMKKIKYNLKENINGDNIKIVDDFTIS